MPPPGHLASESILIPFLPCDSVYCVYGCVCDNMCVIVFFCVCDNMCVIMFCVCIVWLYLYCMVTQINIFSAFRRRAKRGPQPRNPKCYRARGGRGPGWRGAGSSEGRRHSRACVSGAGEAFAGGGDAAGRRPDRVPLQISALRVLVCHTVSPSTGTRTSTATC